MRTLLEDIPLNLSACTLILCVILSSIQSCASSNSLHALHSFFDFPSLQILMGLSVGSLLVNRGVYVRYQALNPEQPCTRRDS